MQCPMLPHPEPPCAAAARQLTAAGVATVPIAADGTKRPLIAWAGRAARMPPPGEHDQFYRDGAGLAVICGPVSGHLEIIDFDEAHLYDPWAVTVEAEIPGLIGRLAHTLTPSGGDHIYYRHDSAPAGNTKLARDLRLNDRGQLAPYTLIETRGEGGYALVPPSPAACHELNRPYRLIAGDLTHLPRLTAPERDVLLDAARQLNRYVEPTRIVREPRVPSPSEREGQRPGDDFDRRGDLGALLRAHGWTFMRARGVEEFWRRPGKAGGRDGHSATLNYAGSGLFYVFSSNAYPLEMETAYSLFAVYTLLEHGGDFGEAARTLVVQGYGEQGSSPVAPISVQPNGRRARPPRPPYRRVAAPPSFTRGGVSV